MLPALKHENHLLDDFLKRRALHTVTVQVLESAQGITDAVSRFKDKPVQEGKDSVALLKAA